MEKTLKLEKLDPTGVVCESHSFDYKCEDDESMRQFRYFLTFGNNVHQFSKDGEYIRNLGK
jgi:hypothetical protein